MTTLNVLLGVLALTASMPGVAAAASCESLATLPLPDTGIIATSVASGALTLPAPGSANAAALQAAALRKLPPFCRVVATLRPTADSNITVELWLPLDGWNGKFLAVGNSGWLGSITYAALIDGLARGYATSSTDTGHVGGDATFAIGHPDKLIDFGYRSEHEMAVKAKSIIRAFYSRTPRYSYWSGCSMGGRQSVMEAKRYPRDFDGIIAGAPGTSRTRLSAWDLWVAQQANLDAARHIPPTKYPMIHQAVVAACDALDGLADGLIGDPTQCHFDPRTLACKGDDGAACLTGPQVETAGAMMTSPKDASGQEVFGRYEPGAELAWIRGTEPISNATDTFKFLAFKDPDWDWRTFDLARDIALAEKADGGVVNVDPDLGPFARAGGKLIMYHGWSDGTIAPHASVNFYRSAVERSGSSNWIRLFMAPGMGHCGGGEGPNTFDMLAALEQWVEKGQAPRQVVASHSTSSRVDRTRPLCPYPQVARYKGAGSIDEARNFACEVPRSAEATR